MKAPVRRLAVTGLLHLRLMMEKDSENNTNLFLVYQVILMIRPYRFLSKQLMAVSAFTILVFMSEIMKETKETDTGCFCTKDAAVQKDPRKKGETDVCQAETGMKETGKMIHRMVKERLCIMMDL